MTLCAQWFGITGTIVTNSTSNKKTVIYEAIANMLFVAAGSNVGAAMQTVVVTGESAFAGIASAPFRCFIGWRPASASALTVRVAINIFAVGIS